MLRIDFTRLRGRLQAARTARRGPVRVPTILQMEAVECGAACLAMVLAYHRKWIPLEEVRVACGVSRDGSKASNILRAARGYGLEAKGYKKEPEALRALLWPAIIHWNFNHFVVLEGFRNGYACLDDPAHGRRRVTDEEFDESFTGVVLTFLPGADFVPGGRRRSLLQALRTRLPGSYTGLGYAVLAGLALVLPGLLVPTYLRVFVDSVLIDGLRDWIEPLVGAMLMTMAVICVLTWLQQHHLLRMETKLAITTSTRFLWHVLHLPMQFFTQRFPGEIASRVGINDRVAYLLSGELATTVLNIVVVTFYLVLMVRYDPLLTGVTVTTAVLNMAALRWVAVERADLNQRMLQDRGKAFGTAVGGLMNIEALKATGSESDFFARWAGYYAKVFNARQKLAVQMELLSALPPLLLSVSTALLLWIGGMRVMDGHLSVGMLVAFQAFMLAFLAPVSRLVALGATAQEARGDMNRLDDVLATDVRIPKEDPPVEDAGAALPRKLSGDLDLRRVSFGYSRLEPALIQDFSLTLKPGARVALVGGSGCGKSTLARLVTGLYEPWAGAILFDGMPREDLPKAVLQQSLAVVDQDIALFEGTIRDNLTLWDPTVPDVDVVAAARDACIHDEISARPGGYSSTIEEGGRNLSGGQRQRLEIARALVYNPAILVLDEATSALDPTTEKRIDDNLRRRGCTCLIVAHRLSTIRDCDEIIVLDGGKIVQRGTHDRLKDEPGLYAELISAE